MKKRKSFYEGQRQHRPSRMISYGQWDLETQRQMDIRMRNYIHKIEWKKWTQDLKLYFPNMKIFSLLGLLSNNFTKSSA